MNLPAFVALFPEFLAASWDAWRAVLARIDEHVRELYVVAGRGSGKSRIAALIATCYSAREYERVPGESIYVAVLAPDRRQAAVTHRYVVGLLRSVPELEALIVAERAESIELSNGVVIEIITASMAAPRGRSYALVVIEEAAFLPTDDSVNPDVELLRAVGPALARVPGSLLVVVSSPYARRGILWSAYKRHQAGQDERVVLVQAPTLELNPTFDQAAVERALEEDPAGAAAEYLAQFRSDVEGFVAVDAIEAVTVPGRLELAPIGRVDGRDVRHVGFLDFAGGSGQDSATLAIAHREQRGDQEVGVLDLVREVRPPFSPTQVCADFARDLRRFGVSTAIADRFAGDFPVEQMRRHGITVKPSELVKSDLYREVLPLFNSGSVELLDLPRLHAQLVGLERRTARGGRDSIDHAPGSHDDMANAVAGALVLAAGGKARPMGGVWGRRDEQRQTRPEGLTVRQRRAMLRGRREWAASLARPSGPSMAPGAAAALAKAVGIGTTTVADLAAEAQRHSDELNDRHRWRKPS